MYKYVLQEKHEDFWLDKMTSDDRAYIEELLKVYREKFKSLKYRVVRLII